MFFRVTRKFATVLLSVATAAGICWAQTMVEPVAAPPEKPSTTTNSQPSALTQTSPVDSNRAKIRIGAGDLLDVSIYGVSDYHQDTRVNESGDIDLPLIGAVRIGGATVQEAQDLIAKSLMQGGYFRNPHVMVVIKDFASQGISVLGEVAKPGVYPIVGTRRLYDVVSLAGGFTAKAGSLVTVTHRDDPERPEAITINNDPAKSAGSNVQIYPGDTIAVSKAGIVYVVGDVHRPGGFVMENNERMTVLEAVAMAQGTMRTAALNSARILRRTPNGPSEMKIPLKEIMAAKANDMELSPDDILFIPGSAAKSAFTRGAEGVFQIATGLAIYGIH